MASSTRTGLQSRPDGVTYAALYKHHIEQASIWEDQTNKEMDRKRVFYMQANPDASGEWIDTQVSADHYVKSYIGKQQFHTREATKYGLGMLNETLGRIVRDLRA